MQDFGRGASHDPDARLEGEILGCLADWSEQYGTERLELAYAVTKALLGHVCRTQPPQITAEWCAKTAEILGEQARMLEEIFDEDRRQRLN
ncbi:hypothetical protein [Nitratireductor alexandrii]|uniref:hypothetical protein n=1 Tax=Nitratireductor alexandrii TaxID=2448161 RepID=UPI000FD87DFB|nr:hypothetical protein [Nitratireductor alexandrii]